MKINQDRKPALIQTINREMSRENEVKFITVNGIHYSLERVEDSLKKYYDEILQFMSKHNHCNLYAHCKPCGEHIDNATLNSM